MIETTSVFDLSSAAGEASLAAGPGDALATAASEPVGAGDAPLGSGEAALEGAALGEADAEATVDPPSLPFVWLS